jgi:hypothetical protein
VRPAASLPGFTNKLKMKKIKKPYKLFGKQISTATPNTANANNLLLVSTKGVRGKWVDIDAPKMTMKALIVEGETETSICIETVSEVKPIGGQNLRTTNRYSYHSSPIITISFSDSTHFTGTLSELKDRLTK